jgi:hypothetical protein
VEGGGVIGGNVTQLFVIWARILRGVLKYVRGAGGETSMGKDPRLDLRRVDLWEVWEATRSKIRPGVQRGTLEGRRADDEQSVRVNARLRGGKGKMHERT